MKSLFIQLSDVVYILVSIKYIFYFWMLVYVLIQILK